MEKRQKEKEKEMGIGKKSDGNLAGTSSHFIEISKQVRKIVCSQFLMIYQLFSKLNPHCKNLLTGKEMEQRKVLLRTSDFLKF
jgi:hypothetical protein